MAPATQSRATSAIVEEVIPARKHGNLVTAAFVIGFPIASIILIPYVLLLAVIYRILAFSRNPRQYGNDATLSWEKLTALVVIPIVGLIATFGTGFGFYLLGDHDHPRTELALMVLVITAVVSVELVVLAVHDLSAHQSRSEVLPYEADVDPESGIARLKEIREQPGSGFLAGIWRTALAEADQDLQEAPQDNQAPGASQVWKAIRSERTSRNQWNLVLAAAVGWLIIAAFALPWGNPWGLFFVLAILVGVATTQLLLSLTISAIHLKWTYHLYLRGGRRIQVLRSRLAQADLASPRPGLHSAPTPNPANEHGGSSWADLVPHAVWTVVAVAAFRIGRGDAPR